MKLANKIALFTTILALGWGALNSGAYACSKDGKEGFLPPNRMYIPVRQVVLDHRGAPIGGGITEAEFNGVIDAVDRVYHPVVAELGGNLVFKRNWTDGTVNAFADRNDGNWNVSMFGGLARHKETTIDGFLLVVCHELGHHIGGAPKFNRGNPSEWASNEGQADYFSTLKCARHVLQNEPNLHSLPGLNAPDSVRAACRASFMSADPAAANDAAICIRSSMGGLALSRLLAVLGGTPVPDFSTPNLTRIQMTTDAHPEAQCRLDTYYSGSLCPKSTRNDVIKDEVSETDPTFGTCSEEKGDRIGVRPRCWYAPMDNNGGSQVDPRAALPGRFY